ncbi:MAG: PilZ domain-containing protein [Nitrospirae bacterium]|nr:PilZ domain-containing protein [Nitrospirota bacterium]
MPTKVFETNRRNFRRIEVELKGSFNILGQEQSEGCAEIQNVGFGGAMFIASAPLNRGELIEMTIYCREIEIPFHAQVVWIETLTPSLPVEFKFGVKYTKISALEQNYLSLIIGSIKK